MKNYKKLFIATLGLLLMAVTGCVQGDCSGGSDTPLTFTVKAYGADMVTEVDGSRVKDVVVYVFDANDLFVEEIETTLGATLEIPASAAGETLKLVAWGNLGGGNQTRPVLSPGDHISEGVVELVELTGAESSHKFPDELFMAILTVEEGVTAQIIPIYPKTGIVAVTASYINYYFEAEDLSVGIGTTYGAITLSGEYVDAQDPVSYRLKGEYELDVFVVEQVNLFAENDISVILLENDVVPEGVTWAKVSPINVIQGERTDVELSYQPPIPPL